MSTWSENGVCWPRDLLKEDLLEARIFSVSDVDAVNSGLAYTYLTIEKSAYDSKVLKLAESVSRTTIAGHAESLLNELARERQYLRVILTEACLLCAVNNGGVGTTIYYIHLSRFRWPRRQAAKYSPLNLIFQPSNQRRPSLGIGKVGGVLLQLAASPHRHGFNISIYSWCSFPRHPPQR